MIRLTNDPAAIRAVTDGKADGYACRISAMAQHFIESDRVLFYTNGIDCAFYNENGNAVVYGSPDLCEKTKEELCEFLSYIASDIRSNVPLDLPNYTARSGNLFGGTVQAAEMPAVSEATADALKIWRVVFTEAFSGEAGMVRYADASMQVRYGMAHAFATDSAAAFVFCKTEGLAVVDQLGVVPKARGNGAAMRLLCHIAAKLRPENGFWFESKDEASDRFYRKNGFAELGKWYHYAVK